MLNPCEILSLAHETLAQLMPIFESIRAQGDLMCTFPLSRANVMGHMYNIRRSQVPKISVSHCRFGGGSVRNLIDVL